MSLCIILPVGVTKETVERVVAKESVERFDCVITVTVPGYEDVKKPIIEAIRYFAGIVGAEVLEVVVKPGDYKSASRVYNLLCRKRPSKVVLVGTTGSRYLYPILIMSALYYWRKMGAQVYLLHGIEGGESWIVPLQGFFAPVMRISGVQRKIIDIVYNSNHTISGKDLIEKYGFTRSVYAVLADLERKGLVIVKRNRIKKTFCGELFYHLLHGD